MHSILGRVAGSLRLRLLVLLLSPLLLASTNARAEGWVCTPERSIGFSYDESKDAWLPTNFPVDQKIVIRRALQGHDGPDAVWAVALTGGTEPYFICSADFHPAGWIACEAELKYYEGVTSFRFNQRTLRFTTSRPFGFNEGYEKSRPDMTVTPFIEIGTCTEF